MSKEPDPGFSVWKSKIVTYLLTYLLTSMRMAVPQSRTHLAYERDGAALTLLEILGHFLRKDN